MATINQLSQLNQLSGSDQLPVYSASNGDARKASLTTLLSWIEQSFVSPAFTNQYASPNVNGTNVQVASTTAPTWLIVTPTGPFAAMTITLPPAAQIADGLELLVFCSQAIATLTLTLNGAGSVFGAPTSLSAVSSFQLRFNKLSNAWYIVESVASSGVVSGTWVPVPSMATPPVNCTFTGNYQRIGNVVTLDIGIDVGAGGSFSFAKATDYFTGLPVSIMPPTTTASVWTNAVATFSFFVIFTGGQYRMGCDGPIATLNVIPTGITYRWTATYFL